LSVWQLPIAKEHLGMAFGTLAAANAVGDFVSSWQWAH
jgi:hypothetical protein